MVYISILNQKEVGTAGTYLDLRVIQDNGISVVPDVDINISDLNVKNNLKFKQFFNTGDGGITFKVNIIILKTDMFGNTSVTDYLKNLISNMLPISVVTDAMDIPNGTYLITKNSERKQSYDTSTEWTLEFTTYTPLNVVKFQNDNTAVLNAINKAKQKNKKTSKKSTKASSSNYAKLKKCNYKTLKYSKQKKVVTCVKYLQKILKKNKCYAGKIDGWFGKDTKTAVKQYQKNYNKKYKVVVNIKNGQLLPTGKKYLSKRLDVTGKVDKATWIALYKGE